MDVARICYVEVQNHVLIYHTLDGDFETKGTMRIQTISLIPGNISVQPLLSGKSGICRDLSG